MEKKYKLVIEEIINMANDECMCLYSKGHHNLVEFTEAVCDYAGIHPEETPDPKHDWWRWIPTTNTNVNMQMMSAKEGISGAFPVTVSWW